MKHHCKTIQTVAPDGSKSIGVECCDCSFATVEQAEEHESKPCDHTKAE